jgi:hypothetical protein
MKTSPIFLRRVCPCTCTANWLPTTFLPLRPRQPNRRIQLFRFRLRRSCFRSPLRPALYRTLALRTCFYAAAACRTSNICFAQSPCRACLLIFPMVAPSKSAVPMVAPLLFLAKPSPLIAIFATIISWLIISSAQAPSSTPMDTPSTRRSMSSFSPRPPMPPSCLDLSPQILAFGYSIFLRRQLLLCPRHKDRAIL